MTRQFYIHLLTDWSALPKLSTSDGKDVAMLEMQKNLVLLGDTVEVIIVVAQERISERKCEPIKDKCVDIVQIIDVCTEEQIVDMPFHCFSQSISVGAGWCDLGDQLVGGISETIAILTRTDSCDLKLLIFFAFARTCQKRSWRFWC